MSIARLVLYMNALTLLVKFAIGTIKEDHLGVID